MQPALFSNLRTNLRSISPHLPSPTSPSSATSSASVSIRSLSPSRHSTSSHLRSRSSSPSPRRFASVLAYSSERHRNKSQSSTEAAEVSEQSLQQSTQQQQLQKRLEDEDRNNSNQGNNNRDESPSRIAFRNLEESWRRFELQDPSTASSPSSTAASASPSPLSSPILSQSHFSGSGSPILPRPGSPLARPPYRELIECASLSEGRSRAEVGATKEDENEGISDSVRRGDGSHEAVLSSSSLSKPISKNQHRFDNKNKSESDHQHRKTTTTTTTTKTAADRRTKPMTVSGKGASMATSSLPEKLVGAAVSSGPMAKVATSGSESGSEVAEATAKNMLDLFSHPPPPPPQGFNSIFWASNEARHILDLPSILGKDPSMISEVLAQPIPAQPTQSHNTRRSSTSSTSEVTHRTSGATSTTPGSGDNASSTVPRSNSINSGTTSTTPEANSSSSLLPSSLDEKAEMTAKAMTKRYAAKNLNMTETEAHRMVQLMAAEIVSLHEERQVMLQRMEIAKQEMLEAAKLLRMKAAVVTAQAEARIQIPDQEMKDMSLSQRSGGQPDPQRRREREQEQEEEEEKRQRRHASLYDKDEWKQ
ncbi:hypothetical protein EDD11_002537 [Mortierella claussenii]|nr:hypothetical protein EDD11_002537 [Mortierella claussenii]